MTTQRVGCGPASVGEARAVNQLKCGNATGVCVIHKKMVEEVRPDAILFLLKVVCSVRNRDIINGDVRFSGHGRLIPVYKIMISIPGPGDALYP